MKKDLISMLDVKDNLFEILNLALNLKKDFKKGKFSEQLKNKSLAMIFEKPSTRTRVSFEVAMTQLGGHALNLSPKELQLGRGETIADTAKVLSRYVDAIMYRAFDHRMMIELAKHATVPVINGLDNLEHPCQIIADLLTIKEHKGNFKGLKLVYVGDGNNVCNSLILGAAIVGMDIIAATPKIYSPDAQIVKEAKKLARNRGSNLEIINDAKVAVRNADVLYTDVWVSMGDEAERNKREKIFAPYQVNKNLVKLAKKNCIIMHCLPAHRGYEITNDVIDSPNSIVFEQAENRLHAQKAILSYLIKRKI